MTKDEVIQRIKQLSAAGEQHVSYRGFLAETGVKDKWLRTQEWFGSWNSLLSEAGLSTREFRTTRIAPEVIVEAVVRLVERIGTWPTDDELRREKKRNSEFPSESVITSMRRSGELARLFIELGKTNERFAAALAHAPKSFTLVVPAMPSAEGPDERVKGYVYMLRSGRSYKIGKSIDPSRRYREIRLELPEETHQIHTIPTDDPSGIEAYWHQRFAAKRIRNTEFFNLTGDDIRAFKRREYQ